MKIIRSYFKKKETIIILFILIIAAVLRLYNISQYMEFLGDEGRDVLVAKDILNGHLTLLGPRSSAGDFYMGPFYYYLITPFLLLFNYDPVGPAVMVALFGVATVLLIYIVANKFFGKSAGFFASLLYSVSPLVLAYSHSSWNPDILPFFSLMLIYTTYFAVKNNNKLKYYFISGFLLGICLQLHYLSLFLAVIIFTYILISGWNKNKKTMIFSYIKKYLSLILGMIISLSPFILFELRHGFLNTLGIIKFIFGNNVNKTVSADFFTIISQVFFRIFARLVTDFPDAGRSIHFTQIQLTIWGSISIMIAVASIITLFLHKNKLIKTMLLLWLFLGILLFGLYKKEIYDYLFTFIFPLPFLLTGNFLMYLFNLRKHNSLFPIISLCLLTIIIITCLSNNPFRYEPNKQRDQVKGISRFVIDKTNGKPYNFALISKGNSDHAYRYYLEILGFKPVQLENFQKDPKRNSVKDQLMIVCEDVECKPLGHPLFDIAAFGRAEIAGVWDVSVVKVFKLIPYKPPKS